MIYSYGSLLIKPINAECTYFCWNTDHLIIYIDIISSRVNRREFDSKKFHFEQLSICKNLRILEINVSQDN